jgi:YD repeat-containing protein
MKFTSPASWVCCAAFVFLSFSARAVDANGDGLDDLWAASFGISAFSGSEDPDGDGRPNLVESINWSDPLNTSQPDAGWGMVWIRDVDGDLLDDYWAGQYMRGGVPLLAAGDEDGDGRKNLEESIVGTNPWVVDAPGQSLNGAPPSQTGPGVFTLSFRGIVGLSYLVEKSTDMVNWQTDRQVWGSGLVSVITIDTDTEEWMFFRVTLQQTSGGALDSDGDGLSDWYELFVFGSNPLLADSDGDGMPDAWEALYGLNLTSSADAVLDGDGDSLSNLDEFDFEMDPRSNDFTTKATVNVYDLINRLTSTQPAEGAVMSYTYDDEGNLLTQP